VTQMASAEDVSCVMAAPHNMGQKRAAPQVIPPGAKYLA
jgi:hypothetical protein